MHYVGFETLVRLYGVAPMECINASNPLALLGRDVSGLIALRPRHDENYTLPIREKVGV